MTKWRENINYSVRAISLLVHFRHSKNSIIFNLQFLLAVKRKKNCSKPNTNRSNKKKSLIIFFTFIIFLFLSVSWKKVTCRFFSNLFLLLFSFAFFFQSILFVWLLRNVSHKHLLPYTISKETKQTCEPSCLLQFHFILQKKKERKRIFIYNIFCNLYVRIIFTVFFSSIFNK